MLRKFIPYLLLFLFVISACNTSSDGKGKEESTEFIVTDGHFSITFPDSASVSNEMIPTAAGDLRMTTYLLNQADEIVYTLSASNFPDTLVKGMDPAALLNNAKQGALVSCGMNSGIDEKLVNIDGYQGLLFKTKKLQDTTTYYTSYKMVFVENTLYQMGVMKKNDWPGTEETDAFLNSFHLQK